MILKDIFKINEKNEIIGDENLEILSIENDSRKILPGAAFFAIKGTKTNANEFIEDAIKGGAVAIVTETLPKKLDTNITYIKTTNIRKTLAESCKIFYGNPSSKLKLVGITGTCGKTSTATILYELFLKLGYKVGLISTIHNKINQQIFPTNLTTPDVIEINKLMHKMVEEKCEYCFMEASSHAIDQERVWGLEFDVAIFTNLSQDHLDYHKNFLEYSYAKKKLFDNLPKNARALINADDKQANIMIQNCKAMIYRYSIFSINDFYGKILENTPEGLFMKIDDVEVWFRLLGRFNAYNLLAVYSAARLLGEKKDNILVKLSEVAPVPGRFQILKSKCGKRGIVDYAHTPEEVRAILESVNEFRNNGTKIIAVIGCGGDRDKSKRPIMGEIAAKNCDVLILTSDNPRTEDPQTIIDEIYSGIPETLKSKTINILQRQDAIKAAKVLASKDDVILLMGKGHEDYQIIGLEKSYFSDEEVFVG